MRSPSDACWCVDVAGTVVLALGIGRVWYDHNLLHMQAEGLESVALEQKILTEGDQSASFAISIADDAQNLLERKKQFLQLPSVKNIIEIDSILAPDESMSALGHLAAKAPSDRADQSSIDEFAATSAANSAWPRWPR